MLKNLYVYASFTEHYSCKKYYLEYSNDSIENAPIIMLKDFRLHN